MAIVDVGNVDLLVDGFVEAVVYPIVAVVIIGIDVVKVGSLVAGVDNIVCDIVVLLVEVVNRGVVLGGSSARYV